MTMRMPMRMTAMLMMMEETLPHPLLLCHPLLPRHLLLLPPELVVEEEEDDPEEIVPEQEAPEALEVILPEEEPEPPQPTLFTVLMRDHEESPSRMFDDLDDLDDLTHADYDVDEWFPEDRSHDRD
jgi:hypothetical protein